MVPSDRPPSRVISYVQYPSIPSIQRAMLTYEYTCIWENVEMDKWIIPLMAFTFLLKSLEMTFLCANWAVGILLHQGARS